VDGSEALSEGAITGAEDHSRRALHQEFVKEALVKK
jgi:hypothetical protein